jgi:EmrB/QacA subfamily drug resistance transporter
VVASALANFIVVLDGVVVTVALPSIHRDLGGGIPGLQWVVAAYTLVFGAFLLAAGAIADRVGARAAFAAGAVSFMVSSALCGASGSIETLIAARVAQGLSAAMMLPSSVSLIGQARPDPAHRAQAVALWAVGGGVASSAGPVLGGVLTLWSWRAIFFINVPVAAATLLLLAQTEPSTRRTVRFDWLGLLTTVTAMGALTYGAIEAGAHGITAPVVLGAFALAIVGAVALVACEASQTHPLVPLSLLRSRNLSVAAAVGFAFMVGYWGLPFVMSLYLQEGRGLSAFVAGVVFVPMMLSGALGAAFTPGLVHRLGGRRLISSGMTLMAAGLFLLAAFAVELPTWGLAVLMVVVGVTGPMVMPPATTVLLDSLPPEQAGSASGVFNTSRQVGGALAVAAFGALLAHPDKFASGVRTSLLAAGGLALAAAVIALGLRHPGHRIDAATRESRASLPDPQ